MIFFLKKFLSFFYCFFLFLLQFLYDKQVLTKRAFPKLKIISIGNLSVGGSGKTPMVSYLAFLLDGMSVPYSIVSRGYKRRSKHNVVVSDKKGILVGVDESGDEAFLLALKHGNAPVFVGDKIWGCSLAYKNFGSRVVILDDGFQSFYIKKNINVLLIDCSLPLDRLLLLPAGVLREPFSAIKRADVVILTKTNLPNSEKNTIKKIVLKNVSSQLFLESKFVSSILKYDFFSSCFNQYKKKHINSPVVLCSGIANNQSFFDMSKKYCTNIKAVFSFVDHHQYSNRDINNILKSLYDNQTKTIITTMKDFVKLKKSLFDCDVFVVDVEHVLLNKSLFVDFLKKRLG